MKVLVTGVKGQLGYDVVKWENIISGEYQNYFEKQYGDR